MTIRCHAAMLVVVLVLTCECVAQQPTTGSTGRAKTRPAGCLALGEQKLKSSDLAANDIYGAALAIEDGVALVASEWDDDNGLDSGSAFVYRCDGTSWKHEQKLLPSDGQAGDNFARSVSLSGQVAVIGAHFDDDKGNRAGSAYVFRFDGTQWNQEQKLWAADGQAQDRFGNTISIDGNVIGVGAWQEDDGGNNAGAAYIYRYDGRSWNQEQKIVPADVAPGDNFGRHVSVSGNVALIGAWLDDDSGTNSGSTYVYRYDGVAWTLEQKLTANDAAASDLFGWACSVDGEVAVVGARGDNDLGNNSGSAYVYRFDGAAWQQEQKLLASDGRPNDWFGFAIVVDQGRILVGAPRDFTTSTSSGKMYLYRNIGGQWAERQKFVPSDGAAGDEYAWHLDLDGSVALTGSWRDDDAGPDSGSAYVYVFDEF